MSVLLNSKDGALNQAFQENGKSNNTNQGFLELQRSLVTFIRGLPGNDRCCDCGSQNGNNYFYLNESIRIQMTLSCKIMFLLSNHFRTSLSNIVLYLISLDATWLSTNFGIIICIECSGIHREMGVHISKIQSLTLDNIGTSQLLVARVMSNDGFNKVMEAASTNKPGPNSTM